MQRELLVGNPAEQTVPQNTISRDITSYVWKETEKKKGEKNDGNL